MLDDLDISKIRNLDDALDCIKKLLNLIETLNQEILELKRQNQELRDDNNRLKGEQGKPKIKPNKKSPGQYSSEKERKKSKKRKKRRKKGHIKKHKSQICHVDKSLLPKDAQFKGYDRVVVQDIKFEAHNTLFLKEKYYSPSLRKSYLASLPPGYEGEFGPTIKALALKLYFDSNMTQPKILDLFADAKINISAGQLSGLRSSPWHHMDETVTRFNAQNYYCQILCNPLYTAYFTTENKNRLTVIDVLRNFRERSFLLNREAFTYFDIFNLPIPVIRELNSFPQEQPLGQEHFLDLLDKSLSQLGPQQRNHIIDAAAIAAYHAQMEFPVVRLLICDDAPQFKLVTEQLALCWVHDARLYKKLEPCISQHRKSLNSFLEKYWDFYRQLLRYKDNPTSKKHVLLDNKFDNLFSTETGYYALDQRIAKTKDKKNSMLIVLDHPEIPLHNNPAELGARTRVRKRVVSFGTRTICGTKAWDTFMTLSATAKKLGINSFNYLYDRISGALQIPGLADIISQRAQEFPLGTSWDTS